MCYLCLYCFCCPLRIGAIGTAVYCGVANLVGIVVCSIVLMTSSEKVKEEMTYDADVDELRRVQNTTAIIFLVVFACYLIVNVLLLIGAILEITDLVLVWLILTAFYMLFFIVAFILREVYYSSLYTTFDLYFIFNTVIEIYLYWIVISYYDELREESDSDSSDSSDE